MHQDPACQSVRANFVYTGDKSNNSLDPVRQFWFSEDIPGLKPHPPGGTGVRHTQANSRKLHWAGWTLVYPASLSNDAICMHQFQTI